MCTKRDSFRAIIVTPGCIADPEVDRDNDMAFTQGTCYLGTHLEHIPPPYRGLGRSQRIRGQIHDYFVRTI